ncbi:MAG TPA: bifunctional DNA-binding transcriptional regulator/O6-methylguanine-DNA methyltransferase Ada [Polyangiales bacterium]|nr:bifunctional DNA-binding transcriptional regulator/O6-methylguanine-DNA methyltransferase Ada [Polyangiales bacterium]
MTQSLLEFEPVKPQASNLDEARWQALLQRQRNPAAPFLYGVSTTGVFCVPWCASRRPRRENVEFFATTTAAERAGYRACKRCRPTEGSTADARLKEACRLLARSSATSSADVAAELGLSQFYFQRFFKARLGITPGAYRRRVLAERTKAALPAANSVSEAIYDGGYAGSSGFYSQAGRELGMPPSAARAGAPDQAVSYTVRRCSYGRVLVAFTERGVCDVALGDSEAELSARLRERFPRAELVRTQAPAWVDEVVTLVEHPQPSNVPIDIQGTAFQERVWQELRRIPAGETRSYTEVARAVGEPQAVRAVARAIASNRVAVLIPCHRVIRTDGTLSGYRWGAKRKARLLERERK